MKVELRPWNDPNYVTAVMPVRTGVPGTPTGVQGRGGLDCRRGRPTTRVRTPRAGDGETRGA